MSQSKQEKDKDRHSSVVVFKPRISLYEELYFNDNNFRSVIFLTIVSVFFYFLNLIVRDSLKAGQLYWNISCYVDGWGSLNDLGNALVIESVIITAGFLCYPIFMCWITLRKTMGHIMDILFLLLYILKVVGSFPIFIWVWSYFKIPSLTSVVLGVEHLRVITKSYSFVRENAYKVLYPWHKDDTTGPAVWYAGQMSPTVGSFSQYVYFLFCPTLLYRDHYPRIPGGINWTRVIVHLACFLVPLLIVLPYFHYIVPPPTFKWTDLLLSFLVGLPVSVCTAFFSSVCLMHGWMNLGSEITRFADRQFYTDWWTSTNYAEFFRNWNIIPHHFIHQYLYKDMKKVTSLKYLAIFIPLLASSIMHEYILGLSVGYVVPYITFLFAGCGVFMYAWSIKGHKTLNNFIFLLTITVGLHVIYCCVTFEAKARVYCAREETLHDLFLPRVIECFVKYNF